MAKESKYYEVSYLLRPELDEDAIATERNNIQALLDKADALADSWDTPKKKPLSYPIDDSSEAFFGAVRFHAAPVRISQLREQLSDNKKVLRFILMEWPRIIEKPKSRRIRKPETTAVQQEQSAVMDKKIDELLGDIGHEPQ